MRTVTTYIEYEPSASKGDKYFVWCDEGAFALRGMRIAGTYKSLAEAQERLHNINETYKALGYSVKGR